MKRQVTRILWWSDSPTTNTGFGVVAKNLIDNIYRELEKTVEIAVVGINIQAETEPIQYNNHTLIVNGYKDRTGREDPFCRGTFIDILKNDPKGYDLVFILQDFAIVDSVTDAMREIQAEKKKANKKAFKSMLYVPVDGYVIPAYMKRANFFDTIVAYNEYSKDVIATTRPELRPKIKVIPHGCNQKDFFPIPKNVIREFRESFFGKYNADKVIFINVNRNQPRKAIQDTIFAFVEAKKNWKYDRAPFLYLNMGRIDPMGHNLDAVMAQVGLVEGDDYMISPDSFWTTKWGVETSELNKIYNACDIFITTTLGEGWSLSVTESMAVRLPVICPYHTSLIEISGRGQWAYTLHELYPACLREDSVVREQTNMYETSEKMIEVAGILLNGNNKATLDAAQNYVKTLNWNTIAKKFIEYFDEIL